MIKVLFVCTGNICRSPMAEAVLRHMVDQAGLSDKIQVDSAGTSSEELGNITHPGTLRILNKHHIPHDASRYARQISQHDFQDFDYLLAMDKGHLNRIRHIAEGRDAKLILFLSYAKQLGKVAVEEVPDPWYTGQFDETYELVTKGCAAFLDYLRAEHKL
jgi:protein-tyrosine phosphatase